GNGRNLIPFAKKIFDCYGIDFSKNMIKNAKKSFKENKLKSKIQTRRINKNPFQR
ncbi:class I SAM-dependent methyltransferase, partial [Candidatus Woesearchaeota archaeon]|nr:class I SAM-dependent methyltransferase [Candidatus Woesearchaeota archaeon]